MTKENPFTTETSDDPRTATIKVYQRIEPGTRWFHQSNDKHFVCTFDCVPRHYGDPEGWYKDKPSRESIREVAKQFPGHQLVYLD